METMRVNTVRQQKVILKKNRMRLKVFSNIIPNIEQYMKRLSRIGRFIFLATCIIVNFGTCFKKISSSCYVTCWLIAAMLKTILKRWL